MNDRQELILRMVKEAYGTDEKSRDMLRALLGSVGYRELETMVAEDKAEDARIEEWIMQSSSQG